jgi:hypothetical protein
MAYARFGPDSDVYVFAGGPPWAALECCDCALVSDPHFWAKTTDEMIAHLRDHQAAGHKVPEDTFEGLLAERAENDAEAN